jgi:hypothetical protein
MKTLCRSLAALSLAVSMGGCGSGDGGGSVVGRFVDDPVEGLKYVCSSGSTGVTNRDGEYTCPAGDNVTFSIGRVTIGTIAAQTDIVTPYSFFPGDLYSAFNLARLLQSVDSIPNDGLVTLAPALVALLPANTAFSDANFRGNVETALNITLVSVSAALGQLNKAIAKEGGVIPDGANIPIANAGLDQNVNTASTVTLNGSGSSDADVGDTLTYLWSFTSRPAGSSAALSSTTAVNPSFTVDLAGSYVLMLTVNDGKADSVADTVTVTATTGNAAPVADAGLDQNVTTNSTVTLNGSGSSDADVGDTLTYLWSFTSRPAGSSAALSSTTAMNPTFTADQAGSYVLRLTVNDGKVDSVADTVTMTATTVVTGIAHNGKTYGTVTSLATSRIWLDRNLGATRVCTSSTDASCYGDYYQWGRNFDGHQSSSSAITPTQAANVTTVGHGNFITSSSAKQYDWGFDADTNGAIRSSNWSVVNGTSVCPVGYRVPTKAELQAETGNFLDQLDAFGSFLRLPTGGTRSADTGNMASVGTIGFLWTSSTDNLGTVFSYWSSSLYYYNLDAAISADVSRGGGIAVRCIKN